jgi:hypothetical protein
MRSELQSVLDSIRGLLPDELPKLLGELEEARATAMLKLSAPTPVPQHDELLDIEAAAARLGMSVDWLYDNHSKLPFTRRIGRKLLFSSLGLDEYIRKGSHKYSCLDSKTALEYRSRQYGRQQRNGKGRTDYPHHDPRT